MAAVNPEDTVVEMTEDPVLDELQITFDALEEADDILNLAQEFEKILQNERVDEIALKVKESSIYR